MPEDTISLLINHMMALRQRPHLGGSTIVLVPESNLAMDGSWIRMEVYRHGIRNVVPMHEDEGRAGVRINAEFKGVMSRELARRVREATVYMSREFVCIGEENSPDAMKDEIVHQLTHFCRHTTPSKTPGRAATVAWHGKHARGFDDHVIALMINSMMKERFFNKSTYEAWR